MDSIIAMFSGMLYPIWIKDKNNEIVYMNDAFIDLFINEKISKNHIDNILAEIKELDNNKKTKVILLNGKGYNHIVFGLNKENAQIIEMLVELPESIYSPNNFYEQNILSAVIDNIPELIFYKDKNLKYVGCNKEFEKFYKDIGVDTIIGKCDDELPIDKSFIDKYKKDDIKIIKTKAPIYIEETMYNHSFETIKTPIIDSYGNVEGIVGVVRDTTAHKWKEGALKQLYYTDSLTNLFNRTYFDEKIKEYMQRERYPIGLIFGDINGLKIVNDTLGYVEGDKLLRKMANLLRTVCDNKGTVFRWGGDEFVILYPDSSNSKCTNLMNEIDSLCSKTEWDNINLSISQGFAILEKNGSIDAVLGHAENKVYKQKILSGKAVRISILETLKLNLESKNIETELHTARVSKYCVKMAKELNLDERLIEKAAMVGKLHDIGKIGIADQILLKQGKLTEKEYEIMKTHSEKGYRLASLIPEISIVSKEILTHHERWDGNGYPLGLQKNEIPILARIVAIVDSFDAMIEDRCYSKGISVDEAIKELKSCAGTHFDPELVDMFINIIDKIKGNTRI